MSDIKLESVGRAGEAVLQNLLQLYTHDFSEHWAGTARGDLNASGRFPDYPLESYWVEERHLALLLRVCGVVAGFCLVNDAGHTGRPVDANVGEFFVARKYRRCGMGTQFAHALFEMRAGIWEVAVARSNVGALDFWRSAIQSHPDIASVEEIDSASSEWNGTVFRFEVDSTKADEFPASARLRGPLIEK